MTVQFDVQLKQIICSIYFFNLLIILAHGDVTNCRKNVMYSELYLGNCRINFINLFIEVINQLINLIRQIRKYHLRYKLQCIEISLFSNTKKLKNITSNMATTVSS